MTRYNLDKLVKVVVNDFYQSKQYTFKRAKKLFGILVRKEGYYDNLWNRYIGTEAPMNHIRKEEVVYEKPEVTLLFQGNFWKKNYFDSYDEAKNFARDLTNTRNWIE